MANTNTAGLVKKTVTITTRPSGVNFATVGEVRRQGRVLHTTDPRPYGYTAAARATAARWALDHGYTIEVAQ